MDRTISWGILAACAGLAACGGGGNNAGVVVAPTVGGPDSSLPFGATHGVQVDMISANLLNDASNSLAKITLNNDGTFSVVLPDGGAPILVSEASINGLPMATPALGPTITSSSYVIGENDVEVHFGEDALGNDLFILARVENGFVGPPSTTAYLVFGDETATAALPAGDATYTGGFLSEVFDSSGELVATESSLSGTTEITADFAASTVGLTFTVVGEGAGLVFTETAPIPIVGAQYTGDIESTGGTAFSGTVIGAFYGPGAEATAGAFWAEDLGGAGATDDLEIIGGFTGFR